MIITFCSKCFSPLPRAGIHQRNLDLDSHEMGVWKALQRSLSHQLSLGNAQENPEVHLLRMLLELLISASVPGGLVSFKAQGDRGAVLLSYSGRSPWGAYAEERDHKEKAQTEILAFGSFQLWIWVIFMRKPDKDLEASWEQMLQQCSAWKILLMLENTQILLATPHVTWNQSQFKVYHGQLQISPMENTKEEESSSPI